MVAQAVADRLRILLRTRLVCVLLRQGTTVGLHAVAAESSQLATSARARFDRRGLQFAADLAARAIAADAPITVAIDPVTHALGDLVPAGMLLAAPIRTSRAEGAVLIYPRSAKALSARRRSRCFRPWPDLERPQSRMLNCTQLRALRLMNCTNS